MSIFGHPRSGMSPGGGAFKNDGSGNLVAKNTALAVDLSAQPSVIVPATVTGPSGAYGGLELVNSVTLASAAETIELSGIDDSSPYWLARFALLARKAGESGSKYPTLELGDASDWLTSAYNFTSWWGESDDTSLHADAWTVGTHFRVAGTTGNPIAESDDTLRVGWIDAWIVTPAEEAYTPVDWQGGYYQKTTSAWVRARGSGVQEGANVITRVRARLAASGTRNWAAGAVGRLFKAIA